MTPTLYLRISRNQLQLTDLASGQQLLDRDGPPFSHPRLLVGDFSAAEQRLTRALNALTPRSWWKPVLAPRLMIHPLESVEGGLSQVEERLLLELGRGAGARQVLLHLGEPLSHESILQRFKARPCA
jgi:hypothetical protein